MKALDFGATQHALTFCRARLRRMAASDPKRGGTPDAACAKTGWLVQAVDAGGTRVLRLAHDAFRRLLKREFCPEEGCGKRHVDRHHTPEQRIPESP
jgi:hypothetical protein